jgi:hypothetical protein
MNQPEQILRKPTIKQAQGLVGGAEENVDVLLLKNAYYSLDIF